MNQMPLAGRLRRPERAAAIHVVSSFDEYEIEPRTFQGRNRCRDRARARRIQSNIYDLSAGRQHLWGHDIDSEYSLSP
jgi:hypothetical protein